MTKFLEPIIISVTNGKGGSGKSTTTGVLSYLSAKKGYETLSIDMDQQNQLKDILFGVEKAKDIKESDFISQKILANEVMPHLDMITFASSLFGFENTQAIESIDSLRSVLQQLPYDFIFIDNPPGLQPASLTGIGVADYALISTHTHYWSKEGVKEQLDTLKQIQDNTTSEVKLLGIIATKRDLNNHNKLILEELKKEYTEQLFKVTIPARKIAQDWSYEGINEQYQDSRILLNVYYEEIFKELISRLEVEKEK